MPESIFPQGFVEAFSIEENQPENWLGALALFNYETLTVEIPPLDLGFFNDPRDEMLEWEVSENVQPPDNEEQANSEENDPLNTAFDSGSDIED